MISTPHCEARTEENGRGGGEAARLQMVSDWLNITPSKDFPLFSPSGLVKEDNSSIAAQGLKVQDTEGAYTPTSQPGVADDPSMLIVSQLQLQAKHPLPINGRTIYSLEGTSHSIDPSSSIKSPLRPTSLSTSSTQTTVLETPYQLSLPLEPSFITTSSEYSIRPGQQEIEFVPSASITAAPEEFTFCYPSFMRTHGTKDDDDEEEDCTRPFSPTPVMKSRYDPASNPWALPKLPPPFQMKPSSDMSLSPLSSLPSTRANTPDRKHPKRFKPSAIMLNRDWLHDRRAYEAHRYGTRSRMSEKGLAEASLREINWDLEKIRSGGITKNEKLFIEPMTNAQPVVDKKKRAGDPLSTTRSSKKPYKREDSSRSSSQPRRGPGRPRKKPLESGSPMKLTTAKSEEVAVSLALTAETPSEPVPSSVVSVDAPSPVSDPEPDDDDDEYIDNRRAAYRKRTATRKSTNAAAVDSQSTVQVKVEYESPREIKKIKDPQGFNIDLDDPKAVRTFPPQVPINNRFPLLYRRFPVCSFFDLGSHVGKAVYTKVEPPKRPQGIFNQPHSGTKSCWNLYQPRYVKGSGNRKEGLCPLCKESPERGGLGKNDWYEMKTSAFNYHLQKFHGISPANGLPFSPPIEFRVRQNNKAQKHQKRTYEEGLCHNCKGWVALEGPNIGDSKVKELYWWKHACACHKGSMIEGERDFWYDDDVAQAIREYELHGCLLDATPLSLPSQSAPVTLSHPVPPTGSTLQK